MAQAGNQQRQWRGPDLSIESFEVSDPFKHDKGWEVNVVVVVVFRKTHVPYQPQVVQFEVDGIVEAEMDTDEGRASTSHTLTTAGSYIISAQIKNLPGSRRTKKILIKDEAPKRKKLAEPKISLDGGYGNRWLYTYLQYEDKTPAEGVIVNVTAFAGGHRIMSDDFPANARGIVEQRIRILAAGTRLIVRVQDHEEKFEYLEQVPPRRMTPWEWIGLAVGIMAISLAAYAGTFSSILAP